MRVFYNINEPTVPVNFGKFIPSNSSERVFESDLVIPTEEVRRTDWYEITWDGETPTLVRKDQAAIDEIVAEEYRYVNAQKAQAEQDGTISMLARNQVRKDVGLPPIIDTSSEAALKDHALQLQGDIDNPSSDVAYNPPLPPGVSPPNIKSLTVLFTREEGWQGNLGFRITLESADDSFIPTNLAMSVYSAANCTGYLYTTGAFQFDSGTGKYFAVCPPGQEPGDVDVHLGILYAAAQLACFSVDAGVNEKTIYAYEEQ
jgi:hypothetical protein